MTNRDDLALVIVQIVKAGTSAGAKAGWEKRKLSSGGRAIHAAITARKGQLHRRINADEEGITEHLKAAGYDKLKNYVGHAVWGHKESRHTVMISPPDKNGKHLVSAMRPVG